MIPLGLSPDDRLLALAKATPRRLPEGLMNRPWKEISATTRHMNKTDPPERMASLTAEAVKLVRSGVNPMLQWEAMWEVARVDWLQVVAATMLELEEEGRPFRTQKGETLLHRLAQEAWLSQGFGRLSWPRAWLDLPDAQGDLPLHAVWHPVFGISGRIATILKGPQKDQWNAYERLDEAIETTEVLLAGGADWEQVNSHGETASDRLLAAHDAGVFEWLNNNANVAWIQPVLEAKAQERRYKALDQSLPDAESSNKPRF